MKADQDRQREIERGEQWLRGFADPSPPSETVQRIKLAVHQACADSGGEQVPGIDDAMAAAKSAVREELGAAESVTSGVPIRRRWVPITALAASVGFALVGYWSGLIVVGPDDSEIQRLVQVMERSPDELEASLSELALDIADLEEDAFGSADVMWSDPVLDGLGDALEELLTEEGAARETS